MKSYSIIHPHSCPGEIKILPIYTMEHHMDPYTHAHVHRPQDATNSCWQMQVESLVSTDRRLLSSCQAKPLTLIYTPAFHKFLNNSFIQYQKTCCSRLDDHVIFFKYTKNTPNSLISLPKWDSEI